MRTGPVIGSLSRQLAKFSVEGQHRVQSALDRLPDTIGLISLRELVPVMRTLPVSRPLNMLNAEAIAAALVLDGELVVTTDSPLLREAATDLRLRYSVRSR